MARSIKWGDSERVNRREREDARRPGDKVAVSGSFGKRSRLSRPEEK